MARRLSSAAGVARDVVGRCRGHDLLLYSAGVTYYAAVGGIPLLLLAFRMSSLVAGEDRVASWANGVAGLLPEHLGADGAASWLAETGSRLPLVLVLFSLVPAGAYGEGLVRALDQLSGCEPRARALRGRAWTLLAVAVSPVVVVSLLGAAAGLRRVLGDGAAGRVLGSLLAVVVLALVLTPLLAVVYRLVAHESPPRRAVLTGAAVTATAIALLAVAAMVALALGVDVGKGFAGSRAVGGIVAALVWLLAAHVCVLVGHVLTAALARPGEAGRRGRGAAA